MMMYRILSLLLLAFVHSECTAVDRPLFILPSSYTNLNASDPNSIRIFHKGLKAVGIEPTDLTLQSLRTKQSIVVSHFLAQYRNSSGFECWFRFSSWLISGLRGRLPTCVKSETDAPTKKPTTTSPPRTTSTTEDSKLTAQTEPISSVEDILVSFDSDSSVVKPEKPEVVKEVKKEEKLVVSKKVDKSAGGSNKKNPKGTTDPRKNKKLQNEVGAAVSAAVHKVHGSVQDKLGQDSASKTSKVSNPVHVPSAASQTNVSASLNHNVKVNTAKLRARTVSKPVKKAAVEEKVIKLCFDGFLFVTNGGKWIHSPDGC